MIFCELSLACFFSVVNSVVLIVELRSCASFSRISFWMDWSAGAIGCSMGVCSGIVAVCSVRIFRSDNTAFCCCSLDASCVFLTWNSRKVFSACERLFSSSKMSCLAFIRKSFDIESCGASSFSCLSQMASSCSHCSACFLFSGRSALAASNARFLSRRALAYVAALVFMRAYLSMSKTFRRRDTLCSFSSRIMRFISSCGV